MIKNLLCACGAIFCLLNVNAQEKEGNGIQFFNGRWKNALELAKKENKLIFLDCNASWCAPCKRLAQNEFSKKEMGEFFNANFINVDLDIDKEDGHMITRKFQVKYIPALVLVNSDGYRIQQLDVAGDKKAAELIEWAKLGLSKKDTLTFEERFGKGGRDTVFLRNYFKDLMAKRNRTALVSALEDMVGDEGFAVLMKNPCFEIIPLVNIHSEIATYFFRNNGLFVKKFGFQRVSAMISRMWYTTNLVEEFYSSGPQKVFKPEVYAKFLEKISDDRIPNAEFIIRQVDAFIAAREGRQDDVFKICQSLIKNARPWQYHDVARLANQLLKGELRSKASTWALRAISLNTEHLYRAECEKYLRELQNEPTASRNQSDPFEMIVQL